MLRGEKVTMETKYEHDFKIELRKVLKRWFHSLTTPVPAPLILTKLKDIHLPLDIKTERRLALRCHKLSVEELLAQLSFDTLLKSWRIESVPLSLDNPLRFSETPMEEDRASLHNVKTQIEESRLDSSLLVRALPQTLRSVELPSLLHSPHSKIDCLALDSSLEELRTELSVLLQRQHGTSLKAFLHWDKNHDFRITLGEFREGVRKSTVHATAAETDNLFAALDGKRQGILTFREFARLFEGEKTRQPKSQRTVRRMPLVPQVFSCLRLPEMAE